MGRGFLTTVRRVALACAVVAAAGCSENAAHLTSADAPDAREWRDAPPQDSSQWRRRIRESGPPPFPGTVDPDD